MKFQIKTLILLAILSIILIPTTISAKEVSSNDSLNIVSKHVQIGINGSIGNDKNTINNLGNGLGGEQNCKSLLGNPNNEDSVAWLLVTLLNYMRILGPLIVVVLSGIDFTKAIIISDDDNMKKTKNRLVTRLVLVAVLFLIPTFTKLLLQLFNIVSDPMCGIN